MRLVFCIREGRVLHEAGTRQLGTAAAIPSLPVAAAFVDRTYVLVRKGPPKHLAANLPATATGRGEAGTLGTHRPAG